MIGLLKLLHAVAAARGDGLRPELLRLAAEPKPTAGEGVSVRAERSSTTLKPEPQTDRQVSSEGRVEHCRKSQTVTSRRGLST